MSGTACSEAESTWRSRELRLVLTAAVALLLAAWLALAVLDAHTDLLLLDFREWRLVAGPPPASAPRSVPFARFARGLRPAASAHRPFRLILELPDPPRRGGFVAAERLVAVEPGESYCFAVLTWSPDVEVEGAAAHGAFRAVASVDGVTAAALPLRRRGQELAIRGIRSERGRVLLRLEVRAMRDRPSERWRRASRTHFELASLRRCRDE